MYYDKYVIFFLSVYNITYFSNYFDLYIFELIVFIILT